MYENKSYTFIRSKRFEAGRIRTEIYRRIRTHRAEKPLFAMDFQNDAEFVGGCIAGGRQYLHINPHGDIEPCVFIHYSDSNIREKTLLEALQSPLFMAY